MIHPDRRALARVVMRTAFAIIVACIALRACGVMAQPNYDEQLTLAIFRVALNEGAFSNARETALIYQVTRAHGRDSRERLAWLRRHSRRVSTEGLQVLPSRPWASRITPSCEAPSQYDAAWWRKTRQARCLAIYSLAKALVEGRVIDEPCELLHGKPPQTWGSPTLDHDRAVRLGYKQHVCHGVANEGWSY